MSKQCSYGLQYSEINYSLFYTEFEIRISKQRAKGFLTIFLLKKHSLSQQGSPIQRVKICNGFIS